MGAGLVIQSVSALIKSGSSYQYGFFNSYGARAVLGFWDSEPGHFLKVQHQTFIN